MSSTFKIILVVLYSVAVIVVTALLYRSCNPVSPSPPVVVVDTTIVTRTEIEIQTDTVVRWYEKIIYKQVEPKIIYVQKIHTDTVNHTDSVFIERIRHTDVMLKLDKKGQSLIIKTFNQNDSLVKEYVFDDVYPNFTVTAQQNNLFVKTQKLYFDGISLLAGASLRGSLLKHNLLNSLDYYAGLQSGFTYKERVSLLGDAGYDFGVNPDFIFKLSAKFNLFK
jgi:hypothetical protein